MMRTLSGGLVAALLLAASSEAMAQTFRNRLPTRPANPAPAPGSGLVTPSMGAQAMPNFANVAPPATSSTGSSFNPSFNSALNPGFNPAFNPAFNAGFNPGLNPFNYGVNPYNAGFGAFGGFSPFANPYGGFGMNPFLSPYNTGFFPGASPFATPFNPYIGNGMYNPFLGY